MTEPVDTTLNVGRRSDWLIVAGALLATAALVYAVTREPILTAAYAGGVLVLAALFRSFGNRSVRAESTELALPDWSVTVAAIDRPDCAVAVTDRAGRLVCANATYESWFGSGTVPSRIPLDTASAEGLANAIRGAWRDGRAEADSLRSISDDHNSSAVLVRAGRGEDHIVWQFARKAVGDLVAETADQVAGKLGRALDQSGIAAALVSPEGAIIAASAGFARRATGNAEEDLVGQDFVAQLASDEADRIFYARDGLSGRPLTMHFLPVADPDQHPAPAPDTVPSLMLLIDGGIGLGGAVAETPAAVGNLEALLHPLPLGLAMADRDGRFLFANPAFLRAAGVDNQPLPPYPSDLVVREDKGALADAVRRFASGSIASGDLAIRLRQTPDEPVSLSIAGVRGLGEASVLLGLNDSTEETRLKRQIAQATKMQAVGQLAGGVAHDFNNVLTAIIGTCDLMLLRHTPGDSDYDDVQQIRANSNRAASLTRQLLAFSRQQTLRPEVLQLPDIVSDASHMLKRLIGEKIELVVRHDRDLGAVRADPTQLGQVVMNLVVNARDAIQSKGDGPGRITLATRKISAAEVRLMGSEFMPAGDYTSLEITDTGSGIPPEHLGKIFEPFFTTKEMGKGTGLGLSTVYGIVKQSGGFIFADSEAGKGATFTIFLPVHDGPAPATKAEPAPEPSSWAGGGQILLVEDEDTVRAVAERALTRAGYTVTSSSDGEEGLEMVRAGGAFDLVVSDVVMPIMDGPAMAREIRKLKPKLPVLFMSGYAEEQLRRDIDISDMHFIPKPFSVQQISDKVGTILGAIR